MKSIDKYIFEKFRVSDDMGNIFKDKMDIDIKDYYSAEYFIILKFEDKYGFYEFDIYLVHRDTFKNLKDNRYVLKGEDVVTANKYGIDFNLDTQISDGVLCAKYVNARYIIFPLKCFKEICEYDDMFKYFGEDEYIDFDKAKEFIKFDAFNCLEKLYPMPPKFKKYKIVRGKKEMFRIYSTIDSLEE